MAWLDWILDSTSYLPGVRPYPIAYSYAVAYDTSFAGKPVLDYHAAGFSRAAHNRFGTCPSTLRQALRHAQGGLRAGAQGRRQHGTCRFICGSFFCSSVSKGTRMTTRIDIWSDFV